MTKVLLHGQEFSVTFSNEQYGEHIFSGIVSALREDRHFQDDLSFIEKVEHIKKCGIIFS